MKYSFTFSTLSDYLNAKASGGVIYNVLRANNPASISQTAISHITGTGQTFIDAVNIIVSREEGGEIGDTLLYCTNNSKYYWLKGHTPLATAVSAPAAVSSPFGNPSANGYVTRSGSGTSASPYVYTPSGQTAVASGTTYYQAYFGSNCYWGSLLSDNGYRIIGFVGERIGDECLIFSDINSSGFSIVNGGSTMQFKTSNTAPTSCTIFSGTVKRDGLNGAVSSTWNVCGSLERAEYKYGYGTTSSNFGREFPVNRAAWDNMVANIKSNNATSGWISGGVFIASGFQGGPIDNGGYSVSSDSSGIGNATLRYAKTASSDGNVYTEEINPADYNYDFDLWFRLKCLVKYPVSYGSMSEESGWENTKKLLAESNGSSLYAAASACGRKPSGSDTGGFSPTGAPAQFGAGKWWLPSIRELWYLLKNDTMLRKKGINLAGTYWSSTIAYFSSNCSAFDIVFSSCNIRYAGITTDLNVFAVTTFNI